MRPTPPRFPRDANCPIEHVRDDAALDTDGDVMKVANLSKINQASLPKVREGESENVCMCFDWGRRDECGCCKNTL